MSEFQYVAFRAIDDPVSDKNMAYMEKQSSRAEITPWSFENEYHYGDFGGNALEMLRRGYDIHLHYANFGTRRLMIRLPGGLPDPKSMRRYIDGESIEFKKDKSGRGGTLVIEPAFEGGEVEEIWDIAELVDELVPLREEIIEGDLRSLYLAHLAACWDFNRDAEESLEGPVPAGLDDPTDAQIALSKFLALDELTIKAAARLSPPVPAATDMQAEHMAWLRRQPVSTKDQWLAKILAERGPAPRSEILAQFRKDRRIAAWPTIPGTRTAAQIHAEAAELKINKKRKLSAVSTVPRKRAK